MFLQKFKFLPAILFFISSVTLAQKVENLRFEQAGKQIIIYYDLTGTQAGQTYDVQVFCSTDGGKTLGTPLKKVTGDAGTNIKGGTGKKVVWDVLSEREKLVGDILFEIQIKRLGAVTVPTRVPTSDGNVYKTAETVTDVDENVYKIVTIGTQVWMAENLKTTKYNDYTIIPLVTSTTSWTVLTTPGYCWYNNNAANYNTTYGALYNWYTVNRGNLCPSGWHVPSDAEWTTLTTYLGGESVAGGKLKETGTLHWQNPNTGATNETGFTALPSGSRIGSGSYANVGHSGIWWSSTEYSTTFAYNRLVLYFVTNVDSYSSSKGYGFSVRCIKD